jgi:Fur family transcriptional regulator, iron response regulator
VPPQNPAHERLAELLREHGIQPSAHRLAVAAYVLHTDEHPGADRVLEMAREALPLVARATIYNTLGLFVAKGLLQEVIVEGRAVYDPNVAPHHHLIDDATGRIHDVPWEAVRVEAPAGYELAGIAAVLHGTAKKGSSTC